MKKLKELKLDEFKITKEELKTIGGGYVPKDCQTYTRVPGEDQNPYDGEDAC
jgi:natural product precursor